MFKKIKDLFVTLIATVLANLFVWCITSEIKKIKKAIKESRE